MATVGSGVIQDNPRPSATGVAYRYYYTGKTAYKVIAKCKIKCSKVGVTQLSDISAYLILKMAVYYDRGSGWIPEDERYFMLDSKTWVPFTFLSPLQRFSTPDTNRDGQPDWQEFTSHLELGLTHFSPVFVQYDLIVNRNGTPAPKPDNLSLDQVDNVIVPVNP